MYVDSGEVAPTSYMKTGDEKNEEQGTSPKTFS